MEAILKDWVECDGGFVRTNEKSKRYKIKSLWPDDLFRGFNPRMTDIGMTDRPNRNGDMFPDEMLMRDEPQHRFERMQMGRFVVNPDQPEEPGRWADAEMRHGRDVVDAIDDGFERAAEQPLYQGVDFGREDNSIHIQSTPGVRPNFFIRDGSGNGIHANGMGTGYGLYARSISPLFDLSQTGGSENENEPPAYDPEAIPRGVNPFFTPINEDPPEVQGGTGQ